MKRSETQTSSSKSFLDELPLSARGHNTVPKAGRSEPEVRQIRLVRDEPQSHFSPDPDAATDRYRLVTPFTLDI